jgi:hypothetical protein
MTRPWASRCTYRDVTINGPRATVTVQVDDLVFTESIESDEGLDLEVARPLVELWALLAGLSYYKVGAAPIIDVGDLPLGTAGQALFDAAVRDGLGEYAYRNGLDLSGVEIVGGRPVVPSTQPSDPHRALVPFGGGIDSVATWHHLASELDAAFFVVSPASGRFAALENAMAQTQMPVRRLTRRLDPQITAPAPHWLNGHVPVTAMITVAAAAVALADGRGSVILSNEHSASVPNLIVNGRGVNHQWSKSAEAEILLAAAINERVTQPLEVASFLRAKSEPWVARDIAGDRDLLRVVRSCNRAFRQDLAARATAWCGDCDKCLFVNLMLAPFVSREELREVFDGTEALTNPRLLDSLRTLLGLIDGPKPFECVGDVTECRAALAALVHSPDWRDEVTLVSLAAEAPASVALERLMENQGSDRVPAHWHR